MFDSIDFHALRAIGLTQALVAQMFQLHTEPGDRLMRVTEVQRDRLRLHDGHVEHVAQVWPTLRIALQMQAEPLVVGDWVAARHDTAGTCWAAARVPPINRIVRRDASGQRQALVGNVDTALLVMGAGQDFNLRRLDRYLALVRLAGVQPLVVLSKADLCGDPAARVAATRAHVGAQAEVVAVNGLAAEAAGTLAPWLGEGQTLVLLGSSGAGKSTLTNTLTEARTQGLAMQATGGVRLGDERGRHTTTTRSLHRCPGGACIIDTPGLRGLQLDADEAQLDAVFDDITRLAPLCRFRDCQHGAEPGCAVRGAVPPGRLLSYHKLQREAQRHEQTLFDRQRQLAVWKERSRGARVAIRAKRG